MDGPMMLALLFSLVVLCIFLMWYFSHRARQKERLLMIEKGLNPNEGETPEQYKQLPLKLGIVVIGLGIGLGIIAILVQFHALGHSDASPISILCVCGGSALVIANRLNRSK